MVTFLSTIPKKCETMDSLLEFLKCSLKQQSEIYVKSLFYACLLQTSVSPHMEARTIHTTGELQSAILSDPFFNLNIFDFYLVGP